MKRFFEKYPVKTQRILEIIPGLLSWILITLPVWLSFFHPALVSYFVIFFVVYFFYKSAMMGILSPPSYLRIKAHEQVDWLKKCSDLKDSKTIRHVFVIVNYKENTEKIRRTLTYISKQDFPLKQVVIVLALEGREGEVATQRAKILKKEFEHIFGDFYYTVHPLTIGEVGGKSSNENYAVRFLKKKYVDERGFDINSILITIADADAVFHPKYLSYLTYSFLSDPKRYHHVYQTALLYYNNIWDVPLMVRVANTLWSISNLLPLMQTDRLINTATYAVSLKMADEVDYWDPTVISEDWHFFFRAFFRLKGDVSGVPIFLPTYLDACQSLTWWGTMVSQYNQNKRWAYGVTDIPYVVRQAFLHTEIPFSKKILRIVRLYEQHQVWPVNFFILTFGATIPALINPVFGRTVMGQSLPKITGLILSVSTVFLIVLIILDIQLKPKRPPTFKPWKFPTLLLQWLTMPIVSFFFNSLPGLDAHTRIMLGKKLEYKVTEKV